MLSVTEILSASTIKRLVVEQGRFLKKESNEIGVTSFYIKVTSFKLRVKP